MGRTNLGLHFAHQMRLPKVHKVGPVGLLLFLELGVDDGLQHHGRAQVQHEYVVGEWGREVGGRRERFHTRGGFVASPSVFLSVIASAGRCSDFQSDKSPSQHGFRLWQREVPGGSSQLCGGSCIWDSSSCRQTCKPNQDACRLRRGRMHNSSCSKRPHSCSHAESARPCAPDLLPRDTFTEVSQSHNIISTPFLQVTRKTQ